MLMDRKEAVALLLAKGADVNVKNKNGRRPMREPASSGGVPSASSDVWSFATARRALAMWFPVFLITVFPKNEKENLSMAERNALKKRADNIFEVYGR
jgi:hypothetical protein